MRLIGVSVAFAVAVLGAATMVTSAPAANGWVESKYAKSDCSQIRNHGRPGLFCEARFSSASRTSLTTLFADETCTNGLRAVERSGMLETSFRSFDYYSGPVPLAQFNIGGNTADYVDTWLWYTDIDKGCI